MAWEVLFDLAFDAEFEAFPINVQNALYIHAEWIEKLGPEAGRPRVDTLNGSRFANMKELRFDAGDGVWQVAFAFDPRRKAILLVAGDKSGISEKRFYKRLIEKADSRYEMRLESLRSGAKKVKERKQP